MLKFRTKHSLPDGRQLCVLKEGLLKEIKRSSDIAKYLLPIVGLKRYDFTFKHRKKTIRGTAYFPKGGSNKVIAFDAGLRMGTRQLPAIALPFARAGYIIFSIYPSLEVAREEADDYLTTAERIKMEFGTRALFFVGISSGAAISLIASALATQAIDGTIAIAPYADLTEMYYYALAKVLDPRTPTHVRKVLGSYLEHARAVMKTPDTAPGEYAAASPIHCVRWLRCPVLIIHGIADEVIPIAQSIKLYEHAIVAQKDVRFIPVLGASVHASEAEYLCPANALGLVQTLAHSIEFLSAHSK